MQIRLRIIPSTGHAREQSLAGSSLTIGRDPTCDVVLREDVEDLEDVVSRHHSRIDIKADKAFLSDLNSTNGTYLNRQRVNDRSSLCVGDKIGLGDPGPVLEVVSLEAVSPAVAPASPAGNFHPPPFSEPFSTPSTPKSSKGSSAEPSSTRGMLMDLEHKQKARRRWELLVAGILAATVLLMLVGLFVYPGYLRSGYQDRATRTLVASVQPAVVYIETPTGTGSGFVLDNRGTIVTNHHVVNGDSQATIHFHDGTKAEAEGYVACSVGKDIVFLRVKPHSGFPEPLPLAEARPEVGTHLIAFGSPQGYQGSSSQGMVSQVRNGSEIADKMIKRESLPGGGSVTIDKYRDIYGRDDDAVWVQTDASLHHGSSGGPLVNLDGEVLGITSFGPGETLNFISSAINIQSVKLSVDGRVRPLSDLPYLPPVKQRIMAIIMSAASRPSQTP